MLLYPLALAHAENGVADVGDYSGLSENLSSYVRFSAMGRYSRLYGGSAYATDVLANQSYIGQASVTLADFGAGDREALIGP